MTKKVIKRRSVPQKKAAKKKTGLKRKKKDSKKASKKTPKKDNKRKKKASPRKSLRKVVKKRAPKKKVAKKKSVSALLAVDDQSLVQPIALDIVNPNWRAVADFDHDNGRSISSAICEMVVPTEPVARTGQTIMIFIGLQSRQRIIQPLLQWGRSQMGGGPFWTVGSCLASGPFGLEEQSQLIRVSPGQHLTAIILLAGTSAGKFRYSCFFENIDQTRIDTNGIEKLENCCVTLEAMRINSRQHYPGQQVNSVSNVIIRDPDRIIIPAWNLRGSSPRGEEARLIRLPGDPDQIDIHFN